MKILIWNGPNLARLDLRDQSIYGDLDYDYLGNFITKKASEIGFTVEIRQSDSESVLLGCI